MLLYEIALIAQALLGFAAATPTPADYYNHQNIPRDSDDGDVFRHKAKHTIVDASVPEPTQVRKAVVYVDSDGNPVQTATELVMLVPSQSGSASASSSPHQDPPPPEPSSQSGGGDVGEDGKSEFKELPLDEQDATPKQEQEGSGRPGSLPGITYSPYTSGPCKSNETIESEILALDGEYSLIRLYNHDCEQITHVLSAVKKAKKSQFKLFLGIFDITDTEGGVRGIVESVGDDWDWVDTVSVGNELVDQNKADPATVMGEVSKARDLLAHAGYSGPVVTVDTFIAVGQHPELCGGRDADYCAVNCHAFFDGKVAAEQAGAFVRDQVDQIKSKYGKRVVVTESGWPWSSESGDRNNKEAIIGPREQDAAIASIRDAFSDQPENLILFTAYDDDWKSSGAFGAEKYWGIGGYDLR